MSLHRNAILTKSEITIGFRLNYLANFFVGPVYSEVSRSTGLARSEFVVLFCLQQVGTLTAQDVCDITGRPKNSISQAVNKLALQGLIKRQADSTDGRRAPLALTPKGLSLYNELIPLFQRREKEMLSVLTEREQEQFAKLLGKLVLRSDNWTRTN
jgi:DNA-binding MarR family transcriptional regulator